MSDSRINRKPNRLIHATSPYLLQHAYNPVDWYEWCEEALAKALTENKPILVSIGYSSCHWCHVMEKESFEDPRIAELMNSRFVCIKVDREERPDIDQVYMEAVQSMGIHGGWPLNVFLTPQQQPFYGGTYFPAQNWIQLLSNIDGVYQNQLEKVQETAAELTRIVSSRDTSTLRSEKIALEFRQALESIYQNIEKKFDYDWGGVDKAPKFVMPSIWMMLLRYYHLTGNQAALKHTDLTLMRIIDGGIYDQAGGGFARYAVDGQWFVPHFEKMLYDNAQLLSLYAEAYALTQNQDFKRVAYETFHWLQREMRHPGGAFYSALDADSDGEEGKFYTWTKDELEGLLGDHSSLFCEYFGVTDQGNWEHRQNILKRVFNDQGFLAKHSLKAEQWNEIVGQCKMILLNAREKRTRPALDDKIVTGWNAMMVCGLLDAFHAFGDKAFLIAAQQCMEFMNQHVVHEQIIYRTFKERHSDTQGFLEDYAHLIRAYLKLYQATFDEQWLKQAELLTVYVLDHFSDEDGFFFFTASSAEKLIARKKEIFDNVIPSSNSIMAMNLFQLGILLDRNDWRSLAADMINGFVRLIVSEPNYMSGWVIAFMEINATLAEVAIVGPKAKELNDLLQSHFLPFAVWSGTETSSDLPLLKDKQALDGRTTIYVCRNYSCKEPVHGPSDALPLIANKA